MGDKILLWPSLENTMNCNDFWSKWGWRSGAIFSIGLNSTVFPQEGPLLPDQEFFNGHRLSCSAGVIVFDTINLIPQSVSWPQRPGWEGRDFLFYIQVCGREIKSWIKNKSLNSFPLPLLTELDVPFLSASFNSYYHCPYQILLQEFNDLSVFQVHLPTSLWKEEPFHPTLHVLIVINHFCLENHDAII